MSDGGFIKPDYELHEKVDLLVLADRRNKRTGVFQSATADIQARMSTTLDLAEELLVNELSND